MSTITIFTWTPDGKQETLKTLAELEEFHKNGRGKFWLDVLDPNPDAFDFLLDTMNFHSLTVEDCIFPQNYPKLNEYVDYIFLIVHSLYYYKENEEQPLSSREVDIFLGKNFLITIHQAHIKGISLTIEMMSGAEQTAFKGTEFLLYEILDTMADNYFQILDNLEDQIDCIEDQILTGNPHVFLESTFRIKKNLLFLRKIIMPQREILSRLARRNFLFLDPNSEVYFRDVYEHLVRNFELIENSRETVTSLMEAHFTVISNRTSDIVKTLTGITIIMMILTVITGYYGMNFRHITELEWKYGHIIVLLVMVIIVGAGFYILKKKKWL
ncbi:MAG: magnesium/cobalt transporter CorA [Elusimicrobiota bacterium]